MIKRAKLIIAMTVFIDVVGVGIVIPGLPIFLHGLISSPFLIETFFTIYAFFGFFAAPVLGGLSDKYGRRPVLILSILGTAIGWFIFAMGSKSLIFLIIGRIIDGITSGNISTAQTYLIDISETHKERTANLGILGAVFGIGFIIGPSLGGLLSKISLVTPFWVAAVLALINTILAYVFLPETNKNKNIHRKISINPFGDFGKVFANKSTQTFLIVWLLYMTCFGLIQSVFSLYGHLAHDFSATVNGIFLGGMGLIIALNQGLLLKHFWLKFFKEKKITLMWTLILVVSYILMAFQSVPLLIFAMILGSFGQSLLRVINNSTISHLSPKDKVGETMGVVQSITFFAMIISPLIGGAALELNLNLPWVIAVFLMGAAFILLQNKQLKWPENAEIES